MRKNAIFTAAAATAILAFAGTASDAEANKADVEKCYGVVKAGKNDCGSASGSHSCAGGATKDRDPSEWLYLPKGYCDRLDGGSTEPKS